MVPIDTADFQASLGPFAPFARGVRTKRGTHTHTHIHKGAWLGTVPSLDGTERTRERAILTGWKFVSIRGINSSPNEFKCRRGS